MFRLYLRALGLLAPERKLAVGLALANLVLAGAFFLEPLLFGHVIDALTHPSGHNAIYYVGLWALAGLVGVGVGVWVSLHADRMAHRRRLAAIRMFFAHAIDLPLSYHGQHHSGRLLRSMNAGTDSLFALWLGFFREHLTTLLAIVVMVPLAVAINWQLALLMIGLLLCFAVFNAVAVQRTRKAQGAVQEHYNQISAHAGDVFGNIQVVQSYTRANDEVQGLKQLTARALAAQYPVLNGWAALSVFTRAASTLTLVAIFLLGAALHARGAITVGGIVSFVGFSLMLIGRLEQFAAFISSLFFHSHLLRDYFAVLDATSEIHEATDAPALHNVRGEVAFEHVDFSYGDTRAAVHDLSFRVPVGARVALVGPTGAGKTTAMSLLYRARDPARGRITIDGQDIARVQLESLRRNVAVVFQDPGLFHRSIEANLKIGDPHASFAAIEAAARAAEADAFIAEKPQAYATPIAERGRSLSGGERQRLAIARAMLKDAPILILDEATSALDNATEARVQRAIDALTQARTTFIIAHRLSTVRNADLILVLDHGRLVEQGDYATLTARGGLFARLAAEGQLAPIRSGTWPPLEVAA